MSTHESPATIGAESPTVADEAGLPVVLPPHLTANFEKADLRLQELYGTSPGVVSLVRLWIACGTSRAVQREFERAILEIHRKTLTPPEDGIFDEDCL
jgi:hypothetical protein